MDQGKTILDIHAYDQTVGKMRNFFQAKGWLEVNTQYRPAILAACEDPWTVTPFEFQGIRWPLPQTGQMWLEWYLLQNPDVQGVYTVSTSYRAEPNPIPGRHQTIFPMFEFEGKGDMVDLRNIEKDLLHHLGFGPKDRYFNINYAAACNVCGTDTIEAPQEETLCQKDPIILLQRFPQRTSPFWNMKLMEFAVEKHGGWVHELQANKIDVLLYGQETIGSAERETDPNIMRTQFETISEGRYAAKLRDLFGEERVNKELDAFLSLDFFPRYGGGIGIHRLLRGLRLHQKATRKHPLYEQLCII